MRVYLFFFCFKIFFICSFTVAAQTQGCIDTRASNYNPNAAVNDGSCVYNATSVSLKDLKKASLPDVLKEISGIIFFNGKLYGHNDSGGAPKLYEIDTTDGTVSKTITLQGTSNVDWEDVTQDDKNIYVGDFGNNENGNRTDLVIYKFPKADILNSTGTEVAIPSSDINIIRFKYEDQVDFTKEQTNNTRFDCEAFFYSNGFLHLFTKNWTGNYTVHYAVNATNYTGVQTATRKDSLNTGGTLITAAAMLNDKTVLLLGYEITGIPSGNLWIISDFQDANQLFETANKRKVGLGYIVNDVNSGIGQVEGMASAGNGRIFVTSEYFTKTFAGLNFKIVQSLYGLGIEDWLPKKAAPQTSGFSWNVSPSPFLDKLYFNLFCDSDGPVKITLHDISGRAVVSKNISCIKGENKCELDDLSLLSHAMYVVSAKSSDGMLVKKVMKK